MTNNSKYSKYINSIEKYLKDVLGDKYLEFKNVINFEKNPDFTIVDLKDWSPLEKELLLLGALRGIDYYIKEHLLDKTLKYRFHPSSYNSTLRAINGAEEVQIYTKRIAHFNDEMRNLLITKGYTF